MKIKIVMRVGGVWVRVVGVWLINTYCIDLLVEYAVETHRLSQFNSPKTVLSVLAH